MADDLGDLLPEFLAEARELVESLDRDVLLLERRPEKTGLVDGIFRAVHTIKGNAGMIGLSELVALAHAGESVLSRLRQGELPCDGPMIDLLLAFRDALKDALGAVAGARPVTPPPDLIGRLESQAAQSAGPTPPPKSDCPGGLAEEAGARTTVTQVSSEGDADTIRVGLERLDQLFDLAGELVLSRNRLVNVTAALKRAASSGALAREVEGLEGTVEALDHIATEIQAAVMRTRMVPIRRAFARLPRLVRELARASGKPVRLELAGEDVELDKTIVEQLVDPLVHLVRNAVDHGIEPSDRRAAAGKDPVGMIRVEAHCQGGVFVLTLEDDGGGIDVEKVRAAAVRKGIRSAEEAARLGEAEVLDLLFDSGFSTAERVRGISGRGVGLDVVRENVRALKGTIGVDPRPGLGARFLIRLPITLAIVEALLFEVGAEAYALPLLSILETLGADQAPLRTIDGRGVIRVRDAIVPVVSLATLFEVDPSERPGSRYYVVCGAAERPIALEVDRLLGREELVVKPLGPHLEQHRRGFAGATVTGAGRVVLILDVPELSRLAGEASRRSEARRAVPELVRRS